MHPSKHFPALLFFIICGLQGMAQTNVVSVDLFGFLNNRKSVSYERTFGPKFSARLSYENQLYSEGETNGQTVYEVRGKGVVPEFRFYPFNSKKAAPLGLFLGTSFRYIGITETYSHTDIKLKGAVFNYTLIAGYKLNYERMTFELLTGYGSGQVSGLDKDKRSQIPPFFTDDIIDGLKKNFRLEVSVGFYFPKLKPD